MVDKALARRREAAPRSVIMRTQSRLLAHNRHYRRVRPSPCRRAFMFQLVRCVIPGQLGDRARALFVSVGRSVILKEREAAVRSGIHTH